MTERQAPPRHRAPAEVVSLVAATALVAAAFLAEPLGAWGGNVHQWLPPLSAHFDPALGPGVSAALAVSVAVVVLGPARARSLRWRELLVATWGTGVLWGAGLALVRGWAGGIAAPLANEDEYLVDVPRVHDVGEVVRAYTDRILLTAPDHWTTHNSGHPPLPLLLYAGLDRAGLGGPAASGVVTALVASTGVVAVLVTLRALGDERRARAAAPFLAIAPMVIWTWVSADGAFMAATAWGVATAGPGRDSAPAARPGARRRRGARAGHVSVPLLRDDPDGTDRGRRPGSGPRVASTAAGRAGGARAGRPLCRGRLLVGGGRAAPGRALLPGQGPATAVLVLGVGKPRGHGSRPRLRGGGRSRRRRQPPRARRAPPCATRARPGASSARPPRRPPRRLAGTGGSRRDPGLDAVRVVEVGGGTNLVAVHSGWSRSPPGWSPVGPVAGWQRAPRGRWWGASCSAPPGECRFLAPVVCGARSRVSGGGTGLCS